MIEIGCKRRSGLHGGMANNGEDRKRVARESAGPGVRLRRPCSSARPSSTRPALREEPGVSRRSTTAGTRRLHRRRGARRDRGSHERACNAPPGGEPRRRGKNRSRPVLEDLARALLARLARHGPRGGDATTTTVADSGQEQWRPRASRRQDAGADPWARRAVDRSVPPFSLSRRGLEMNEVQRALRGPRRASIPGDQVSSPHDAVRKSSSAAVASKYLRDYSSIGKGDCAANPLAAARDFPYMGHGLTRGCAEYGARHARSGSEVA